MPTFSKINSSLAMLQDPSVAYLVNNATSATAIQSQKITPINRSVLLGRATSREQLNIYIEKYMPSHSKVDIPMLLQSTSRSVKPVPVAEVVMQSGKYFFYSGWQAMDSDEDIQIEVYGQARKIEPRQKYSLNGFEELQFAGPPAETVFFVPPVNKMKVPPFPEMIQWLEDVGLWATAGMAWALRKKFSNAFQDLDQALQIRNLPDNIRIALLLNIIRLPHAPTEKQKEYRNEVAHIIEIPTFEIRLPHKSGQAGRELSLSIHLHNRSRQRWARDVRVSLKCSALGLDVYEIVNKGAPISPDSIHLLSGPYIGICPNEPGHYPVYETVEFTAQDGAVYEHILEDFINIGERIPTINVAGDVGLIKVDGENRNDIPDISVGQDVGAISIKIRKKE